MLKLAWIGLFMLAMSEVTISYSGAVFAGLAQTFVGFGLGAALVIGILGAFCFASNRCLSQIKWPAIVVLSFVPNIGALWMTSKIYWYCIGFGIIIGFIWSAVSSFGSMCQRLSDAMIKKHSDISSVGG